MRVRHKNRGSTYEVLGEAEVQISIRPHPITSYASQTELLHEGDKLVVYQGKDGKLWARFPDEFNDGRFEVIDDE